MLQHERAQVLFVFLFVFFFVVVLFFCFCFLHECLPQILEISPDFVQLCYSVFQQIAICQGML